MSANVDLNLLTPLAALLEHRSVTEAARSLRMGQPAMSAALSRLRRLYSDELLVRVGQRYELTPLAASLRESVGMVLDMAVGTLSTDPDEQPARLQRTFSVGLTEYELLVIGSRILALVRDQAPNVRVHFDVIRTEHLADLPERLRREDCLLVQDGWLTGHPSVRLYTDDLVLAACAGHPLQDRVVSRDDLLGARWATISDSRLLLAVGQRMLTLPLQTDHVMTTTDSSVAQLASIAGTDLITPVPRRLVDLIGGALGVRALDAEDVNEPLATHLVWHPARERDRGLTWFRQVVQQAAADLPVLGAEKVR